ncbi:helix-turn-helix transcriptional regulator [Paenibacillus sp. 1-18]|uniref:helix-turn-helix transcriptional regulator n=1 Tax=Paenibacillus sp. 1-18 TaxID=1333846 RepID=UPI000470253A|nr:helix-turn-helix transcriptional regulator [Paenibacillus sp. 1-18]
MSKNSRRVELGDFLRTRRERLDPQEYGFPAGGRRRTTGLRREELAQVAGVGVSWYTWLEQGRDINVSPQVLDSIARALQLDWVERRHMFDLAIDPAARELPNQGPTYDPVLQGILDSWGWCPAYAVDRRWNYVAWNEAASEVFADYGKLTGRDRNLVWYLFTHPSQRQLLVHWEREARKCLALFRASSDQFADDPWFREFSHELSEASPEFREWWPLHDIRIAHTGHKELNHPVAGKLSLRPTTLMPAEFPELKILLYIPLPQENTAEKLQRLAPSGRWSGALELQLDPAKS